MTHRRRRSFWTQLFHKSPSLTSLPTDAPQGDGVPAIRINSSPFISQEVEEEPERPRSSSLGRATVRRPILRKQASFSEPLASRSPSASASASTLTPPERDRGSIDSSTSSRAESSEESESISSSVLLNVKNPKPEISTSIKARAVGAEELVLPVPGPVRGRPRLFSHPNFSTRSEQFLLPQTAPILQNSLSANPMKFIPAYFRRFSSVSQQGQGLVHSDSMVSLTNRALVSFIAEENFAGLQHLLESRRVVVDDRDEAGSTALMVAASRGKPAFVRSLIEHGADVNAEDQDNWTALLFASKEGHDEIIVDLLDHGAVMDHRDMGGWTPLMWACYKGRYRCARVLLEKGAEVNAYGNYNVTCLGWAAGRGFPEIVRDLLQHGAKVNTGDKYGTTPLIWACRKGYIEIVDMLLHAEANVDACGMTSWTPVLVATAGNHVEVVKLLLDHKPNVNALDKDGCSALTLACKEGFHEIAVTLINYGAYINISDRGGSTNLIHAAKGGHRSIVEALLKKHADVNVQGKDRKTALYWSVEKNHAQVVRFILGSNPELELATKDGDTALMKAVRNRNAEIVALLLEKRAKVSAADKNGDTCLHIAMRARSKQIVELLLRNPVHSQLLYRPNRVAETPYNIDRSSPKPILPQIFGHRGLNTQEDGENLLGYSLYSSALADMLSDPALNMPITVGLFARWGSGKSFLLSKLREEMKSFARQWFNPIFSFNFLILIGTLCLASFLGVIAALAVTDYRWIIGGSITGGLVLLVHAFLFIVWFSSRRAKYEWSVAHRLSRYLAIQFDSLKLIFQVLFCHPPGSQFTDQIQAQPINFYFTEQAKISSTAGGENSVIQMLSSLYACLEKDYGTFSTRLYRAFKPRPASSTADWKWRKLCCIPYCVIFTLSYICSLVGIVVLVFSFSGLADDETRLEFNGMTVRVIMYACIVFVGVLVVSNLFTIGQVFKTIVFSHRRHLQRAVSKINEVKAEGFLYALKSEVNLITDMVRCLDSFTGRQSRMVVIVDGLDSGEQEKVLQVLDAVHILFSDPKAPFIILLAIDPHIIAKMLRRVRRGIELNVSPVLNETCIGGHEYLRNLVHLPFFLQNAALRKVKHVKMMESNLKTNKKVDEDLGPQIVLSTRRASVESAFGVAMPLERFEKPNKKKRLGMGLKMSESVASSMASNLNKAVSGPTDLKKILLGDDYFSDINPRSMRRLMNIIYITGRLLKAFNIDFNWYHLTTWVNVTEQWPYRLSWMVIYAEHFQKDFDDSLPLKTVYERVHPFLPVSKDSDPNIALDRDDKKLDVYLGLHKTSLLVSTMYVFLPFTISLDPQLRKEITELYPLDTIFKQRPGSVIQSVPIPTPQSPYMSSVGQMGTRYRNQSTRSSQQYPPGHQFYPGVPTIYPQPIFPYSYQPMQPPYIPDSNLVAQLRSKKLQTLSTDGICDLLKNLPAIRAGNVPKYEETVKRNNICGRVLMSCDLPELKDVLQMTFGDWEIFKNVILTLREIDRTIGDMTDTDVRINITSPDRDRERVGSKGELELKKLKPNVLQKQVTMEDQMICGALELLNDEARDDAMKGDDSHSDSLSPIHSEEEPVEAAAMTSEQRRSSQALEDDDETDVLYVVGTSMNLKAELPNSPCIMKKLDEAKLSLSYVNESQQREEAPSGTGSGSLRRTSRSVLDSPGKRTRTPSFKGRIMNPKSPGLAFDTSGARRKQRAENSQPRLDSDPTTTSDDEEEKVLLKGASGGCLKKPRPMPPQSPKKRNAHDSRLSKIKSIFTSQSPPKSVDFRSDVADDSEPAIYFRNSSGAKPWTQYRAPTPLPPFGSDEYYRVIKSSNPSPTTSNESELGSTPEHLSSGENLFLPGPPDLPESPFPRRNFIGLAHNSAGIGFVPYQNVPNDPGPSQIVHPTPSPTRARKHTAASSGEDQQRRKTSGKLSRVMLNQSDPVLSSDFTLSEIREGMMTDDERRAPRRDRYREEHRVLVLECEPVSPPTPQRTLSRQENRSVSQEPDRRPRSRQESRGQSQEPERRQPSCQESRQTPPNANEENDFGANGGL